MVRLPDANQNAEFNRLAESYWLNFGDITSDDRSARLRAESSTAFDEVVDFVNDREPKAVGSLIARLLDQSDDDDWTAFVVAGPLEDFLTSRNFSEVGVMLRRAAAESPTAARILGVVLSEPAGDRNSLI